MAKFFMPSLGADMEAGTLLSWEKNPGETVRRGDVIAVVETQKGAIEIEVFEDGVLETYLVDIGKRVPVGTPLALIRGSSKADSPVTQGTQAADKHLQDLEKHGMPEFEFVPEQQPAAPVEILLGKSAVETCNSMPRIKITPAAGKLAATSGIDPRSLAGTGPQGVIVLADIAARIQRKVESTASEKPAPMAGMREAIACAMTRSKREIPHYYLSHTLDLSAVNTFISRVNADRPPGKRLITGALFIKALALATKKFPEFNGHFIEGSYRPASSAHVGMAINIRGGGLVAPAIHDVQDLDMENVMAAMRDLVERVRAGRFRAAELSDPTITLSSLGERGVESLYGIVYPPQVAIVGIGTPVIRPWVSVDGKIDAKPTVTITLAADHRVSDGHRGALFLKALNKLLLQPEGL